MLEKIFFLHMLTFLVYYVVLVTQPHYMLSFVAKQSKLVKVSQKYFPFKSLEIRQSTIYYAGLLGRWDK